MTWYAIYALPWPWDAEQGQRFVALCYSEEKAIQITKDVFNWNIYEIEIPPDLWGKRLIIPSMIPVDSDPKVEIG